MRRPVPRRFPAFALVVLSAALATAQTEPEIRDLTGDKLTSEALIDVLKPKTEPPPAWQRARGARSLSAPAPRCDFYKRQTARGISVKPAADIAAVEILFAYDSAALTSEASRNLNEIGKALTSADLSPCCFRIEGHADNRGSDAYNQDLSERRARSVVTYLTRKFDLDVDRVLSVGLGEKQPVADNESEAGRRRNRRVHIVNLGYGEVTP